MRRGIWWVIAVVIVGGAGYWWFFSGEGDDNPSMNLERRAVSRRGDLVVSVTATGVVEPIEQVEVKSKASGEIIDLPIEEGDFVKRGDLIARLDRTLVQNTFDQAEADLSVAEATLRQRDRDRQRVQKLVDQNLTPLIDLDEALLSLEQAKAQLVRARSMLSTAKEQLEDTEIRAPIDGIVLSRPVEIGQVISSGTTTVTGGTLLCIVANMTRVHIVADVDETDIGRVSTGMAATTEPDAYPNMQLDGTVQRIAPQAKVQQNVTVFEVTVLVDNGEYLLKAGMNASVEMIIEKAEDAILIPARAIQMRPREGRGEMTEAKRDSMRKAFAARGGGEHRRGGGGGQHGRGGGGHPGGMPGGMRGGPGGRRGMMPAVQVVRDGTPEWQPIRTGLSNLDEIEVVHGLAEGDTVVYSLTSGAMQSRAAFRDRMRSRSSVPGMR